MTTLDAHSTGLYLTAIPMTGPEFDGPARWDDAEWVHKKVMSLFPPVSSSTPRATLGVLYRVEPTVGPGRVLIQSHIEPSTTSGITKPLPDPVTRYPTGTLLRGRVTLNTVKTVNRDGTRTRSAVGANAPTARHAEEALISWAATKLPFLTGDITLHRTDHTRKGRTPLVTATFDLVGTVIDPAGLTDAIRNGVGKARAYGCGLLTVAPV